MNTSRFPGDATAYTNLNETTGWPTTGSAFHYLPFHAQDRQPAGMLSHNFPFTSQTVRSEKESTLERMSYSSASSSPYKYFANNTEQQQIYNYQAAGNSSTPFRPGLFLSATSGEDSLATSPISNPSPGSSPSQVISDDDSTPTSWLRGHRHRDPMANRRREAHTQAEQKRRDEIKKGYQALQDALPSTSSTDVMSTHRISKAAILQSSIEYLEYLTECKRREAEELQSLKKDLMALQIMKQSYDKIAQQLSKSDQQTEMASTSVSDTDKFRMFQRITDKLFQSFDACVNPSSFAELSGTAFSWLEEHCKPTELHDTVSTVLRDVQIISRCTKELDKT